MAYAAPKSGDGVFIGKYRNNPDKSSYPWFLDGPAVHIDETVGNKVRGGMNPFIPPQLAMRHHDDTFIRFVWEQAAAAASFYNPSIF
jgi:hypothetical protein